MLRAARARAPAAAIAAMRASIAPAVDADAIGALGAAAGVTVEAFCRAWLALARDADEPRGDCRGGAAATPRGGARDRAALARVPPGAHARGALLRVPGAARGVRRARPPRRRRRTRRRGGAAGAAGGGGGAAAHAADARGASFPWLVEGGRARSTRTTARARAGSRARPPRRRAACASARGVPRRVLRVARGRRGRRAAALAALGARARRGLGARGCCGSRTARRPPRTAAAAAAARARRSRA